MSKEDNIKVGVRVRPLSSKELGEGDTECLAAFERTIDCGEDHKFTYDYAFDTSTTNEKLYSSAVKPLLDDVFCGFNSTIMAYGQTGSGKTFTMGTDAAAGEAQGDTLGVLPRFVNDMFSRIAENKKRTVKTSCSLLEIYNDQMRDLLVDKSLRDAPELKLDTSTKGQVNVQGLTRRSVGCTDDVLKVLGEGLSERVVGATNMNAVSSRSHAIFEIVFESSAAETTDDVTEEVEAPFCSKITFVDLAGSERLKRTGAEGGRKDEGIAINKSLLVLGTVINSLCKGLAHVPYRECKLTRLLQNALGGNSRTLFLACVSPASNNIAESLNSLRYANRAREIKNAAVVNMDANARLVLHFRQREEALKNQLIRERFFGGKEIPFTDPEFLERKAMPSTADYMDTVFRAANIDPSANAFRLPKHQPPGFMSTSSGAGGGGSGAQNAMINAPIQRPRYSEATRGKIDVSADLPEVLLDNSGSNNGSDSNNRRNSEQSTGSIGLGELEAEASMYETEEELAVAKQQAEDEMAEHDEALETVNDDLNLKNEVLQKMKEKMETYAARYNRLRDEFDVLNQAVATNDEEKQRLEQQIAKVKQESSIASLSKKSPNLNVLRQKLADLNSTLKETKTKISTKQREINALKREKDVAQQLQRAVERLKNRKVQLERARKESEQRHTQIMAEKNRKIAAAQRQVTKITMEKRKAETKMAQTHSTLSRQQERNQKLKENIVELKRKYNQVVQGNAIRAKRGGRRTGSRAREIGGEGCHKEGSVMQTDLLRYVRARVQLSQKAVELQDMIKKRQQMLLEQAVVNAKGTVPEIDSMRVRLERNRNAIVIGNSELEHLQSKCGPQWAMLSSLTHMQRGSVVSYLIDEIISTTADYTNAEKLCVLANKQHDEAQAENSKLKVTNKTLKARNAMLSEQARRSFAAHKAAGTSSSSKRANELANEAQMEDSPRKRNRAKSDPKENDENENKHTNKRRSNVMGKKKVVTEICAEYSTVASDEEFGAFCSGGDALEFIDEVHHDKAEGRFKQALKAVRGYRKESQAELNEKEHKKRLTLSGMSAVGGLTAAERKKQGDDFLRQGNAQAVNVERRVTMGGRMNGIAGSVQNAAWKHKRIGGTGKGSSGGNRTPRTSSTRRDSIRRASGPAGRK